MYRRHVIVPHSVKFAPLLAAVPAYAAAVLVDPLFDLSDGQPPVIQPALGSAIVIGLLTGAGTQMLRHFPVQPFPRMRADHYM